MEQLKVKCNSLFHAICYYLLSIIIIIIVITIIIIIIIIIIETFRLSLI